MYKIISNSTVIGICEKVRYIRVKPETGAYVEATEETADGIAFNSVAYNLPGKTAIAGADVAEAVESSEAITEMWNELVSVKTKAEQNRQNINNVEDAVCELDEMISGGE